MNNDDSMGPLVKKIGKKYFPIGRSVVHSESLWREKNWEARREKDGRCYFELQNGAHGGGIIVYEITDKEFEDIKQSELSFDDLVKLTLHNPSRPPIKVI